MFLLVPAPQGMEATQAMEPPRGTGEGVGTAVEFPTSTPVCTATSRYFSVRRVSVRYLVVCYKPFIGRGRAYRGHSLANQPDVITQLHF